jgi:diguanylate cyclase (GGDEF)-like protein/PAS domain S-box-containing protein
VRVARALNAVSRRLPRGLPISDESWNRRHAGIRIVLAFHLLAVPVFALVQGNHPTHAVTETLPIAGLLLAASQTLLGGRRFRSIAAVLGLIVSSATLTHLSGGSIEMHFHFFVMVAVISLYQDWTTYLTAIVFVAFHHGVIGVLAPNDVFSHGAAQQSPWKWAAIHAGFVLAASAAHLVAWRLTEDQYDRAEAEISRRERRFRTLIENSSDIVTVIGVDGTIQYDSPSITPVLGYLPAERVGTSIFDYLFPEDFGDVGTTLANLLEQPDGATVELQLRIKHADGSPRWIEVRGTKLLDQPDIRGLVANFNDITDRKRLEEELNHQAFHDALTGLANRSLFLDRIEHALVARTRSDDSNVAVLYIDVDDFKTVNDGMGHAAGDAVLVAVAERLLQSVREADTCARLGGDEFGILLEGVAGPDAVCDIAAKVLEALALGFAVEGNLLALNASVGVVLARPGDDASTLVRNADLAMYRAKAAGKGRYEVFESAMYEAVIQRLALKSDLANAVARGEFVAHYQPIVDLGTGDIVGAEALARWEHPTRGLLAPIAFIELAEETGLIVEVGRAVLRQACADAVQWAGSISVNLSARQLQDPGVVDDVRDALHDADLDPSRLTLEITESVLVDDPDAARDRLLELKALGVEIALDDFGTGYSSLSYLKRFPVDRLKIDKSFVDALVGSGQSTDASLVGAITGIGELLHLAVTAEGIERPEQVTELLALGCRSGQGYYFAKPLPLDAFLAVRSASERSAASSSVPRVSVHV